MNALAKAALTVVIAVATVSSGAQSMPSDEALANATAQAKRKAATALSAAADRAQSASSLPTRKLAIPRSPAGVDPARIATQYRASDAGGEAARAPQLIIFASLSMPEESLRRLSKDAARAGAVVAFRGLKFGLRNGGWARSMEALKPLAESGADVQIHPELFARYAIRAVPTVVVAAEPAETCAAQTCETAYASVNGDVTLEYALDEIASRSDAIGAIARERLARLQSNN